MIAHFDLDAFYAAVAQRDEPRLRGLPVAVAHESRRAVVLTASYEARAFGVHSAIPLFEARRRCPELLVVPPDFERYREVSRAAFAIFARAGTAVEGLSLDEAYVALASDVLATAVAAATVVRAAVREELGLAVSAGVALQKMVAKIACDDAKPDGLRAVEPGTEAAYLAPLGVERLWGIGPKTTARLRAGGIATIGALAELDDARTFALFGRTGAALRELARGHDERAVEPDRATRSVSSERTFEDDLREPRELRAAVECEALDVAERLARAGLRGATVGIKLRFADRTALVRQTQLAQPTDDPRTITAAALLCLERAALGGRAVRLVGVRVASLDEGKTEQLALLS
ncbi:MAG: DNA polymerase IV [Vulcanimicrobiaceae bacterium]